MVQEQGVTRNTEIVLADPAHTIIQPECVGIDKLVMEHHELSGILHQQDSAVRLILVQEGGGRLGSPATCQGMRRTAGGNGQGQAAENSTQQSDVSRISLN